MAKESWAVLRNDRSLTLFPVVSAFAMLAAVLLLVGPGVVVLAVDAPAPVAYVLWAIALYILTFIGIYCNVALSAAASHSLDGNDTSLSDGFSVARQRTGVIAKWAAVSLVVGLLLNALEAALAQSPIGRIVAGIISGLLGAAWSIVTFFVVPSLALEGLAPKAALERSGRLIKERWGEGLIGSGSIMGIVFLALILPSVAIGALGVYTVDSSAALGGLLIAVGVVGVIAALLIGSTLNAIFRVALFRYATDGAVAPGFDRDSLENAFRPKRRGRI
ncbi:DUF6159 family protein [Conexibacter sp. CPCC 206217]|uniref:DUF6159 family protein n=1 Tax=Conexibacter sp. CPCC 206217 TaxID=3064574 RepID=UPI0027176E0A|nr:DUF6159 family protein [Conexibacter sp. CPCC 206217]MDO8213214.1 DUF6159 family protein [Conexibacter sp. CPCC 206217]